MHVALAADSFDDDFNNTCKESVADCNESDVEKDEKNLEELVAAERHHRLKLSGGIINNY